MITMASDWYNNCDDDFNDEMTLKKAKKIVDVYQNSHYGGYVYDVAEYKAAKQYINRNRR